MQKLYTLNRPCVFLNKTSDFFKITYFINNKTDIKK